jgi:ADP-ribosylglycohydrolase
MLVHDAIRATFSSAFTSCATSLPEDVEPGSVVAVPNDGHIALTVRLDVVAGRQQLEVVTSHRMTGESNFVLYEDGTRGAERAPSEFFSHETGAPQEEIDRARRRYGTAWSRYQEHLEARAFGPTITLDRYRGCLLGGAVGDALGAAIEFDDMATIRRRFGDTGIQDPVEVYGRVGAITDDTQMTLATGEGILRGDLWGAYQRWLQTQEDPRLRRAPGNTCLAALKAGRPQDGRAANGSKGCGGVMRVAPCGLVAGLHEDGPFHLGVAAAALTHGHPTGYLAAGALAVVVRWLCRGRPLDLAVDEAIRTLLPEAGSEEVVDALHRAQDLAEEGPGDVARLGQGWIAEEALAIAVYCALVHPGDFAAAVRLAANHSGDSDSTAAITGNIMGAYHGVRRLPPEWLEVLELREKIEALAVALHDGPHVHPAPPIARRRDEATT